MSYVVVPASAPTGDAVPLVLMQNGIVANPDSTVTLVIRPRLLAVLEAACGQ